MTSESTTAVVPQASPTTSSPPAKRVKTDATTNMASSENNEAVPVPKLDQAPPLLVKKLSDKARLPTRGSAFAAGYDLYAAKATTIPKQGKALVDTDIAIAVPAGTCTSSSSPSPPFLSYPTYLPTSPPPLPQTKLTSPFSII